MVVFREMQRDEVAGVAAVHNAAFAPWIASLPPVYRQRPLQPQDVQQWDGRVFVAVGSMGVIAYAHAELSSGRQVEFITTDEHAGQSRVAVHPQYLRGGIGRRLVSRVIEELGRSGATEAWAGVYSDNDVATAFLTALGFHPTPKDDSVLATLDLSRWRSRPPRVPGLVVRELRQSDVEDLRAVFGTSRPGIFGPDPTEDDIRGWMSSGWAEVILVAELGGRVVGSMEFRSWGVLGITGVHASFRGRGIGAALLAHTLDVMRAKGISHALADTGRTDAAAIRVYGRLGFDTSRSGQGWTRGAALLQKSAQSSTIHGNGNARSAT